MLTFFISMFVLSLCRQLCPDKLPVQTDVRLGEGADGEVFSIVGDPHRVLKLGVLYERHDRGMVEYYQQIQRVLDYMMHVHPDAYVKVYEHGYLGRHKRKMASWRKGEQEFIIYYYLMERLYPITEDEGKVFHTILSHEDRNIKKDFSPEKIREMLQGMSRGLDFDAEKVNLFCRNIKEAPVSHLDIATRNIMKDELQNFKLIDLDRISLEKIHVKT